MAQPAPIVQTTCDTIETSAHSAESSLREQALTHSFLAELLTSFWRRGRRDIEVLRCEVDCGGYDIVLEANGIVRHLQLKATFRGSKVQKVDVSTKLARKPSGCVLWIEFDSNSLLFERYLWFGGTPGTALPDLGSRISRHSKANANGKKLERPLHRVLNRGRFHPLTSIDAVVERLFG